MHSRAALHHEGEPIQIITDNSGALRAPPCLTDDVGRKKVQTTNPIPRWFLILLRVGCVITAVGFLFGAVARILLSPRSPWTYLGIVLGGTVIGWLLHVFWHWNRHDSVLQKHWAEEKRRKESNQ